MRLRDLEDPQQTNTLIYCMGDAVDDTSTLLSLPEDELSRLSISSSSEMSFLSALISIVEYSSKVRV